MFSLFFFFNDTATTEIYTLSLHDALPIFLAPPAVDGIDQRPVGEPLVGGQVIQRIAGEDALDGLAENLDRKSTRLNSSHTVISYAVFCLKKKNKNNFSRSRTQQVGTARRV